MAFLAAVALGASALVHATSAQSMPLKLTACKTGQANQQFGNYEETTTAGNGTSISAILPQRPPAQAAHFCLDIENFGAKAGSVVYAWPCGAHLAPGRTSSGSSMATPSRRRSRPRRSVLVLASPAPAAP